MNITLITTTISISFIEIYVNSNSLRHCHTGGIVKACKCHGWSSRIRIRFDHMMQEPKLLGLFHRYSIESIVLIIVFLKQKKNVNIITFTQIYIYEIPYKFFLTHHPSSFCFQKDFNLNM